MKKRILLVLIFCATQTLLWQSSALCCTVCHSKNPKMVRMHAALGYKDCFICHGPGAKKQRTTDERCIRCHKE